MSFSRNFAAYASSVPSQRNELRRLFRETIPDCTLQCGPTKRSLSTCLAKRLSLCVSSIGLYSRAANMRQSRSASNASAYRDRRTRARNIFILRCGTKDHVLLAPQSRQRINSGRSPCRRIASENRGAQEDDTGQRQGSRIIGLAAEQKPFDKLGRDQR